MLEEMYEWYIYLLDVESDDAQSGRLALSSVKESVEKGRLGDGSLLSSPGYSFDEWARDHIGPSGLIGFGTPGATRSKRLLGLEALEFGLTVSQVLFVWNQPAFKMLGAARVATSIAIAEEES